MCSTKMRHHLRQYMPNKPHKWWIKLFVLCDSSGYAYQFEVYNGAGDNVLLPGCPDLGATSNVVVRLSQTIPDFKHHIVYFVNFYTSIPVHLKQPHLLDNFNWMMPVKWPCPTLSSVTPQAVWTIKKLSYKTCNFFIVSSVVFAIVWPTASCTQNCLNVMYTNFDVQNSYKFHNDRSVCEMWESLNMYANGQSKISN